MATTDTPTETCPSCAVDGGYGHAMPGVEYHCPSCDVLWSPNPEGAVASTRLGNWWQTVKVHYTSVR